jgi:hypothetical protein
MCRWAHRDGPGFEPGSGHVGFVVDKVALGQVFSEYFGFPCQSLFHKLLHNHPHLSSGACTIGQKWPQYLGTAYTGCDVVWFVAWMDFTVMKYSKHTNPVTVTPDVR